MSEVAVPAAFAAQGHAVRRELLRVTSVLPAPPRSTARAKGAGDGRYTFPHFPGCVREYAYVVLVDEQPWSRSFVTLPESLAVGDWDATCSPYELVAPLGATHRRRDDRVRAVVARESDAHRLGVRVGTPLVELRGVALDGWHRVVLRTVHLVRRELVAVDLGSVARGPAGYR